jgi:hypothetical protein
MTADHSGEGEASPLQASAAVEALLGREALDRLRGEVFRRYDCWRCGQAGSTEAEPATVIVERYRSGGPKVLFAHARCTDSQVVDVDAESPDPEAFTGMRSKIAVLEYAAAPRVRPLLILEPHTELMEPTAGGEQINLWMSELLDKGFTMMRTGGQFPGPAEGWLLQLGPDVGRLLAPDDTVVYEGPVTQPEPWLDLVQQADICVVLIGTIGLYAYGDDEMTTIDLLRLLNRAARSGELAGALVMTDKVKVG